MSDDKKEPWLNYLALTTVIIAVCATLSTFKGGSYSTRSVMNQSKAASEWSYYQAKSIKTYLYELQKDKLDLELLEKGSTMSPSVQTTYKDRIADYTKNLARYESEKAEIQTRALEFEKIRDDSAAHSGALGLAVIFLQMAILLCSISALLKQKLVWALGGAVGLIGVVYFVNGFLLFLK